LAGCSTTATEGHDRWRRWPVPTLLDRLHHAKEFKKSMMTAKHELRPVSAETARTVAGPPRP
jgi:hypothetical protein